MSLNFSSASSGPDFCSGSADTLLSGSSTTLRFPGILRRQSRSTDASRPATRALSSWRVTEDCWNVVVPMSDDWNCAAASGILKASMNRSGSASTAFRAASSHEAAKAVALVRSRAASHAKGRSVTDGRH
eukprot:5884353-Prymnesium_polylepis.1